MDESSSRNCNRRADRNDVVRDSTAPECELIDGVPVELELSLPAAFSVLPKTIDITAETVAQTATMRDARRRRTVSDNETFPNDTSPCVEIEHAASGLRCVLSHQDGSWLLSVTQSPTSDADVRELIDNLRIHFQTHGLGPIDVVV